METLITAAEFRTRFDISPDITDARIVPHVGSASRRLRKWVGDTAYATALAGVNADLKSDLQNAESYLAYHYALHGLHFNLSSKGVVGTSQTEQGHEMRKYPGPAEIAQLSTQMLELAREIVEPYMVLDPIPDASWMTGGEC